MASVRESKAFSHQPPVGSPQDSPSEQKEEASGAAFVVCIQLAQDSI